MVAAIIDINAKPKATPETKKNILLLGFIRSLNLFTYTSKDTTKTR